MGKTLKYGSHDYPSKFGFSGSASDGPVPVRPHVRKRVKMQAGGLIPTAVPGMRPPLPDVVPGGAEFGGGPGIASGSMSETDRLSQSMPRGHAPLTAGGIAAALSNAMSITDPVKMGIMTGIEHLGIPGIGEGSLGGLQNIPGWKGFSPATQALVKSGQIKTMAEALAHSEGQGPSGDHGGATGERSDRDQAGGGPKGGQQMGGGKRAFVKGGRVRRGVKTFNKRPLIKETC